MAWYQAFTGRRGKCRTPGTRTAENCAGYLFRGRIGREHMSLDYRATKIGQTITQNMSKRRQGRCQVSH
jgi:hypothetical protein